ncbi:MAG: succinylglutamate desuccinylase/aspartoacylase family protein [Rhodospirillaceae bacterium]|nr:succinylglutamate desuccinylase/aspartoacylase family protein [Rhodospirillaceae bacterium]
MSKLVETLKLVTPSPGTSRELKAHRYGTPGAGPKAYFQAALHSDEYPGLLVANHLIALLDAADAEGAIEGEIIVVPVANPIGLGQQLNGQHVGRYEFSGGGNFNRSWPDLSDAVYEAVRGKLGSDEKANIALIREALATEVAAMNVVTEFDGLRKALLGLSITADMVFDLHCDNEALMHLYSSVRHTDLVAELACDIGAPVSLLEMDPGGGPFDEANAGVWWRLAEKAGEEFPIPAACFAVTVELRGRNDVYDEMAKADAQGLFRFLQRRGVIAGDPGPLPAPVGELTPLEGTDVIRSPGAGIVAYCKDLGDRVEAGEVIGELIDLMADDPTKARTPITSKASGLFFTRMNEKLVRQGAEICKVAGKEPLEHRKAGGLLES